LFDVEDRKTIPVGCGLVENNARPHVQAVLYADDDEIWEGWRWDYLSIRKLNQNGIDFHFNSVLSIHVLARSMFLCPSLHRRCGNSQVNCLSSVKVILQSLRSQYEFHVYE
jgi:hypothetical protein